MTLQQLLWKLFRLWLQGHGGAKIIYAWEGEVNHAFLSDTGPVDNRVLQELGLTDRETVLLLHWD